MKFNGSSSSEEHNSNSTTTSLLKTINPSTEQVLNEYEIITKEQLDKSVRQARQAFLEWRNNIDRRAEFLYAFAAAQDVD